MLPPVECPRRRPARRQRADRIGILRRQLRDRHPARQPSPAVDEHAPALFRERLQQRPGRRSVPAASTPVCSERPPTNSSGAPLPLAGREGGRPCHVPSSSGRMMPGGERGAPPDHSRALRSRDLRLDAGAVPGRAVDSQAAVEGLDAGREPAQARAAGWVGPADAVVGDGHGGASVGAADAHRGARRASYLPTLAIDSATT